MCRTPPVITLCLHTAWSCEDLCWSAAYNIIKLSWWLNISSLLHMETLSVLLQYSIWLVCIAGPAVSPGQCGTDTKPFHRLKEPQERRGKPAKPEAILSLVCHTGRASDHEVIIHVFNYDNHTKKWWNQSECQQKKEIIHDQSWESQATTMGYWKY